MSSILSESERELLHWICIGKTIPETAQLLNKSQHTLRNQLRAVYEKLNVNSRIQLVQFLSNQREQATASPRVVESNCQ